MALLRALLVSLVILLVVDTESWPRNCESCVERRVTKQEAFSQECYNGWFYHDGSCYGFGQEAVTWANAESLCRVYEASLAEIDSREENDFLKDLAKNNSLQADAAWLGATDIFNEGHWVWVNSKQSVSGFTDWAPGQPDSYGYPGGEDCLQIFKGRSWQWNDEDCDHTAYFICELRIDF